MSLETSEITRLEELVAEVKKIRTSNRILMGILAVVAVVALLAGATALYARSTANKAHYATDQAAAASEAAKEVAIELSVEACRARNAANVETRKAFSAFVDGLDKLVMTPEAHTAINQLRSSIPPPEAMDRDCTAPPNGLGPDDYPS